MTDHLNGTYSYQFSVSRPGRITVSVLLYTVGGVYGEYYPNIAFSGNNGYNNITSQLNMNWGGGTIYSVYGDNVSSKYYFRVKAPTTDTFTFYLYSDDDSKLYIDNSLLITRP
mmetsp:Transcript_7226/g.8205  ORF Transcript_7226/g.8205 Transcript_7226/m.8205 type:complete len:113 (+) Transcript_7226:557-895(+)